MRIIVGLFAVLCFAAPAGAHPGSSGIKGIVTLGPLCPVERAGEVCEKPLSAPLEIGRPDGTRITSVKSGDDGQFCVALRPGEYVIKPLPLRPGSPYPYGKSVNVRVSPGAFAQVAVQYDTGIR